MTTTNYSESPADVKRALTGYYERLLENYPDVLPMTCNNKVPRSQWKYWDSPGARKRIRRENSPATLASWVMKGGDLVCVNGSLHPDAFNVDVDGAVDTYVPPFDVAYAHNSLGSKNGRHLFGRQNWSYRKTKYVNLDEVRRVDVLGPHALTALRGDNRVRIHDIIDSIRATPAVTTPLQELILPTGDTPRHGEGGGPKPTEVWLREYCQHKAEIAHGIFSNFWDNESDPDYEVLVTNFTENLYDDLYRDNALWCALGACRHDANFHLIRFFAYPLVYELNKDDHGAVSRAEVNINRYGLLVSEVTDRVKFARGEWDHEYTKGEIDYLTKDITRYAKGRIGHLTGAAMTKQLGEDLRERIRLEMHFAFDFDESILTARQCADRLNANVFTVRNHIAALRKLDLLPASKHSRAIA